jgi:hypothetical protein
MPVRYFRLSCRVGGEVSAAVPRNGLLGAGFRDA